MTVLVDFVERVRQVLTADGALRHRDNGFVGIGWIKR